MTLLDLPIPPKPDKFTPYGAPPGVAVDFDAYGAEWVGSRPTIVPRVQVVHTNGASVEASLQAAYNWSNAKYSNTHAHYNFNAPQVTKNLPTNLRAIANSTPKAMEDAWGVEDSSFWTIAYETADRGSKIDTVDLGDFLYDHDELLARCIAYEAIVWGIPIKVPLHWTKTGVATHTAPWDGVYTIYTGKTCPGTTKKERVLRGDILPRAQQIYNAWMKEESPMFEPYIYQPPENYDRSVNPAFIVHGTSYRSATGADVASSEWKTLPRFAEHPSNAIRYDLIYKSKFAGAEPPR